MKFKIGQRIAIYGFDKEDAAKVFKHRVGGGDDQAGLLLTDGGFWVHPKQCRRLFKKPRKRVFVHFSYFIENERSFDSEHVIRKTEPPMHAPDWIELVEVREKK